ncbi:SCP2 sterol-binding domain-containing protein [Sphaerisporangium sp. TRM90804]|uniref:SCP2 sterol-binding domain-containing protein n=1 Tax=Sphaerisporangium sp. TRM90804 TaxID=3031113 RepID=UPI002448A286|nr:SCP2 sterol-binding domain-containing protein [Sphaerisporangium sp. TRM90804]MDH2430301.1 SCP2 sterol-binding domain-containing protein [Sphaerisporangium sp. TRM90804]
MASVDECRAALDKLGEQFGELDGETRSKHVVDRRLSCRITDLEVTFYGRIHQGGLDSFTQDPPADGRPAEVRIKISSDDLLAMVNGELDMAKALFGGRVKIDASLGDLLRLRKLL